MEKCKFTKRYFNNQIVMFRYSYRFHVIEKFYHIEDDYETDKYRDIDDKSDKAIMSIYYHAARDMDNQKKYFNASVDIKLGGFEVGYFPTTTRLDRIRNKVFKTILNKLYSLQIVSLNLGVKIK